MERVPFLTGLVLMVRSLFAGRAGTTSGHQRWFVERVHPNEVVLAFADTASDVRTRIHLTHDEAKALGKQLRHAARFSPAQLDPTTFIPSDVLGMDASLGTAVLSALGLHTVVHGADVAPSGLNSYIIQRVEPEVESVLARGAEVHLFVRATNGD